MITNLWHRPATIERNNFIHKSLSCWSYNIAVGCEHACRFCYVPDVSTRRMAGALAKRGVQDPDAEWGNYVFLRKWDERAFLNSLAVARGLPLTDLNPDGNRAVMLCTTTDPYQTGKLPGQHGAQDFNFHRRKLVRDALHFILNASTLNVRILTRSPLAREDFNLMKLFGKRLLFGMSLPTLNNKLAKIYEPKAPSPSQRLATLRAAKEAGLHVFVAVAPVYPECDAADMKATLEAVKELDPVTIFMEPINIRADNVARIKAHAASLGEKMQTEVFATPESWREYAMKQMVEFEVFAKRAGFREDQIHLWPDQSLGSQAARKQFASWSNWSRTFTYSDWLNSHWNKISAWPK